jgi:hypothetical protein
MRILYRGRSIDMIDTKLRFIWPNGFRGEMWKINRRRTTDDERQLVAKAHMAFRPGELKRQRRYQMGNQYIEEEQTRQWPKEKVQKDNERSTKHTHKTKDCVTQTLLQTGRELGCSGRLGSFCSTSCTRLVNLVTNLVISQEWGKNWKVFTTSGTYLWSFVTQIFHSGQPSHGGDRKTFQVITST